MNNYKFSKKSQERLLECAGDIQKIFNKVIIGWDCSVLCGYRDSEEQNKAYKLGKSKIVYPNSKHNKKPSIAIDVAPYPIKWKDYYRFYAFGGYVLGISDGLFYNGDISHRIRWGGDWDNDKDFSDQKFNDLVHFELIRA